MFPVKKPEIHARGGKEQPIDFAWMTYIGVTELGFTEWEVNHMHAGKWADLMYHFKRMYNMRMERKLFEIVEKRGSLMDL